MKNFIWLLLLCANTALAQHTITIEVQDSTTHETLPGVSVSIENTSTGANTNTKGIVGMTKIPSGMQTLVFTYVGYETKKAVFNFPLSDPGKLVVIYLRSADNQMDDVVISSSRTGSRIENLPMKVEVLGQEEMDEENMIKPGNVASILGDLSVIHIQQTSATTGNTTIRLQGLNGRYTQLLRDGLPLFDGFSGNFGVLSIPPLDLKQVEVIKGSSSTLYGGGAIGGIINFISKAPTNERDLSFTLNTSSLKENNINSYYAKRFGKFGITFLAQQTIQAEVDVNKDGFSDVPKYNTTVIHPRLFYYPNNHSQLDAGYALTYDNRKGGDMQVIQDKADALHTYLEKNKSLRNTADFHYSNELDNLNQLTVKGSFSNYRLTNFNDGFNFKGNQASSYFEANDLIKIKDNDVIIGTTYTGEYFTKKASDLTAINDYTYHTAGLFVQDGWHIDPKFLVEAGLRADHHNRYGWFVLPRIAILYRPLQDLSVRLSSGLGYKTPNIFTPETLSEGFQNLLPIADIVKSERSAGVNFDAGYHIRLGDAGSIDIDQALYYTRISNPIVPVITSNGEVSLNNMQKRINSAGTDTYVRLRFDELELYFGYNHTISKQVFEKYEIYLPFSPQNKYSTTIAYEIERQWRFGIEGSLETHQYINENQRVRNFPFLAAMVERKFGSRVSLVINCENINDFRQSKYESLNTGSVTHPVFKQLWAPIDGRVTNLALRLKL